MPFQWGGVSFFNLLILSRLHTLKKTLQWIFHSMLMKFESDAYEIRVTLACNRNLTGNGFEMEEKIYIN